jgi:hypothetical protein
MINPAELDVLRLRAALQKLEAGFADLPEFATGFDVDAVTDVVQQVARCRCGSIPTTTRSTAVAPAPHWRKSASSSSETCSDGRNPWVT